MRIITSPASFIYRCDVICFACLHDLLCCWVLYFVKFLEEILRTVAEERVTLVKTREIKIADESLVAEKERYCLIKIWVRSMKPKAKGANWPRNASAKPKRAKQPSSPAGLAWSGTKWLVRLVYIKDVCVYLHVHLCVHVYASQIHNIIQWLLAYFQRCN